MRIALTAAVLLTALAACRGSDSAEASNSSLAVTAAATAAPVGKAEVARAMHERREGMEQIGKATKAAGRALKSSTPDLATIRTSAATIARLAPKTGSWFPAGSGPEAGKTGAKSAIWQKPGDFAAKVRAFEQSAAAFKAAAQSGDRARIAASFGALGNSCKACHQSYRSETSH